MRGVELFIQVAICVALFIGIWLLSSMFNTYRERFLVGLGVLALLFTIGTNLNNLFERSFLTMLLLCGTAVFCVYKKQML